MEIYTNISTARKYRLFVFPTSVLLLGKYQVCFVNTYYLLTRANTLGILFKKGHSSNFLFFFFNSKYMVLKK